VQRDQNVTLIHETAGLISTVRGKLGASTAAPKATSLNGQRI
jgi:hypothetical protein